MESIFAEKGVGPNEHHSEHASAVYQRFSNAAFAVKKNKGILGCFSQNILTASLGSNPSFLLSISEITPGALRAVQAPPVQKRHGATV